MDIILTVRWIFRNSLVLIHPNLRLYFKCTVSFRFSVFLILFSFIYVRKIIRNSFGPSEVRYLIYICVEIAWVNNSVPRYRKVIYIKNRKCSNLSQVNYFEDSDSTPGCESRPVVPVQTGPTGVAARRLSNQQRPASTSAEIHHALHRSASQRYDCWWLRRLWAVDFGPITKNIDKQSTVWTAPSPSSV